MHTFDEYTGQLSQCAAGFITTIDESIVHEARSATPSENVSVTHHLETWIYNPKSARLRSLKLSRTYPNLSKSALTQHQHRHLPQSDYIWYPDSTS